MLRALEKPVDKRYLLLGIDPNCKIYTKLVYLGYCPRSFVGEPLVIKEGYPEN